MNVIETSEASDNLTDIMGPRLLKPQEVADNLAVSKATLESWRKRGIGPAWIKFDRAIRYHPQAIADFKERLYSGVPFEVC